ncbi:MAG: HAMP domain-containing protein, partial [Magnetococcales bacterium]|nr:HAMP domain-containing protein [Magnetococcales bacterium]
MNALIRFLCRILPGGLFGRLMLVLAGGMTLALLASAAIHFYDRDQALYTAGSLQTAQRIADVIQLLDPMTGTERQRVAAVLKTPLQTIQFSENEPVHAELESKDRQSSFVQALLERYLNSRWLIRVTTVAVDADANANTNANAGRESPVLDKDPEGGTESGEGASIPMDGNSGGPNPVVSGVATPFVPSYSSPPGSYPAGGSIPGNYPAIMAGMGFGPGGYPPGPPGLGPGFGSVGYPAVTLPGAPHGYGVYPPGMPGTGSGVAGFPPGGQGQGSAYGGGAPVGSAYPPSPSPPGKTGVPTVGQPHRPEAPSHAGNTVTHYAPLPPSDEKSQSLLPRGTSFRIRVRFQDGTWAVFHNRLPGEIFDWPKQLLLPLSILLAGLIFISLLAVRLATRPLTLLAEAAEALGRDIRNPPLAEVGSRELKQAAHAFNTMQGRLLRYVQERTQLLAALSHDLKTPITRMRLRTEMMDEGQIKEKTLHDLEEMEEMAASALAFIRGMEGSETFEMVDVLAMLETIQAEQEEMGRDVTVLSEPLPPVTIKPKSLKRCLDNLVANAVRQGRLLRYVQERTQLLAAL